MKEEFPKVGDVVEITTEGIAYGGDAVARLEGLAIFVPFAAPGERLRARIVERKRNYARAVIEEVLAPSSSRRAARCRHFGECGGCQLQHITYEAQLEAKAAFVADALKRVGKIDWPRKIEVLRASEFGYRSRAQVKIGPVNLQSDRPRSVGFNRAGSRSVCDVLECPVLTPDMQASLESLRSLVMASPKLRLSEVEMAAGENGVATDPGLSWATADQIEKKILGATYRFAPSTFFQVNDLLLEALINEATQELSGSLAIDLYAGVGLFTIPLARQFDKVIGVESEIRSSAFARENLSSNRQTNAQYRTARVEDWLSQFNAQQKANNSPPPELVLLDPPRAGAAHAITQIAQMKPRQISYVSCDPATLARDLRVLLDAGYELERVKAIDLFPQTYHVETVARLRIQP